MHRAYKNVLFVSSVLVSAALATSVRAITVDGYLDAGYGSALSTQTCNTGYGNATTAGTDSSGGSELDAAYGTVQSGDLYLFLAGNLQNNGNHFMVFVQAASGGQSVLNISNGWGPAAMNGSKFSAGFAPNLMFEVSDYHGSLTLNTYGLGSAGSTNTSYGPLAESSTGFASGTLGGISLGLVNTNTAGVNSSAGTAASASAALGVGVGLEVALPLSQWGYTGGNVEVMAALTGSSDNNMSNQLLPGLPSTATTQALPFDFSSTTRYFTVAAVPEPSSISLVAVGLLGAVGLVRRRKA